MVLFSAVGIIFTSCRSEGETVSLSIEGHEIVAEVARTPEERQKGLMHRENLEPRHGMLFVFEYDQKLSFWMKNTGIPLSIAYIAQDGTIKEIHRMRPGSLKPVESSHSVRYALEVHQGLYEELGIKVGDTVTFPDGF